MNERRAAQPVVVVALGGKAREDYAIELARELVQSEAPELLGLFVENAQLLEHARSQWAREILLTGQERGLDRGSLERQLRSQAALARSRFETATARLGLQHRFEVTRGDVFAEPIRRAAAAEALVVCLAEVLSGSSVWPRGFARQFVEARLPLVLLAREGWLSGRSIAVVVDEITASNRALAAATRIARQSRSPLSVLLPVSKGRGIDDSDLQALLAAQGVDKRSIIPISGAMAPGVAHAARACRARLLVMPSRAQPGESESIDELMRRFQGALMLVRP
ncbi:MAG: hypothetical protein PVF63_07015 [Gammaproteobacteria bacterium]|jgi:hypothetical protein